MASCRTVRTAVQTVDRMSMQSRSCTATATIRLARHIAPTCRQPQISVAPLRRSFSTLPRRRKEEPPNPSGIAPAKSYTYQEVYDMITDPSPTRVLIDVREPNELLQTGRIPTAKSIPISSAPDAFFMSVEDFESKFGFPRPGEGDEVIFYCKAGVRSRQAQLLAGQARPTFGGKIANYPGSWVDWEKNGGKAEPEGAQGEQSSATGATTVGDSNPARGRP